jgi:osmotically-inducible protein OsmY
MNMSKRFFPIFIAAAMLFGYGCAGTTTHESTGEYVDDTTLTTKVKTAIFNEPTLKVFEINVETFKSVVQLSGFVNTGAEVARAGTIARSVTGVASVKNDIRLK